jgi:phage terminase large subunit-like protein
MPQQQQVADVSLEVDPATGKLAFGDVVVHTMRQQGKSYLELVIMLERALSEPNQRIIYTAQTGSDARKKLLDDWLPMLKQSKFAGTFRPRLTSGHESLKFHNGSSIGLVATTVKAGHGSVLDLVVLDEAFAHPDARLEQALRPATVTRPQPQIWIVSTAGTPGASPYLWDKVEQGRQFVDAGVTSGTAYFEWSAEDDDDPGDPDTWRRCMPALGITVTEEAVATAYNAMNASEFCRAYLNRWVTSMVEPVIPLDTWHALEDRRSTAQDPVALAFDVSPDRSWSSVAFAGKRNDGLSHIEVADNRPGTGWVVDRVDELVKKLRPSAVYCDLRGAATSLIDELRLRDVEVTQLTTAEQVSACGQFFDAATQDRLRHLGTTELTMAVSGATKRSLSGAWAWNRPASGGVEITSLVACTIALWGAGQAPDNRPTVFDLTETKAYRDFMRGHELDDDDDDDDEED